MENYLLDSIRHSGKLPEPDASVILIEFIDDLISSEYSITLIKALLGRWAYDKTGKARLILCTFADAENVWKIGDNTIIQINPLKISRNVVVEKAKDMNIHITEDQILDLAELDTMLEVVSALKDIAVSKSIKY